MSCRTVIALAAAALVAAGCASMVDRATTRFADNLEGAVLDYDEPGVVADGLPSYLLLLESRVRAQPEDAALRLTTARLTGAYAGLFIEDPGAERRLTVRAREHADIGACLRVEALCDFESLAIEALEARLEDLPDAAVAPAYAQATAWTAWIGAHRNDFAALAHLPRVEILLEWVAQRDPAHDDGAIWLYLAVLNSQRPPAAGGEPDKAKDYYQRALAESDGGNLLIKVFMADELARLTFDRDLYVKLLEEVLEADPDVPGYRLTNQVARQRAQELLDQTEAIFD